MQVGLRIVWCNSMTDDTSSHSADASDDAKTCEPGEQTMAAVFDTDVLCPDCSYNLRGLTSDRCPECGRSVEELRLGVSQIPWVHRAKIGRCKAYWKTVMFVMTKTRQFSAEVAHSVSYQDAQKFRWLTILHAYLPILVATVVVYLYVPPMWKSLTDAIPAMPGFTMSVPPWYVLARGELWPVALLHFGVLLFLAVATGVPSYFFHPRDLPVHVQNRAVALSYYAPAALAWTFIPLGIYVAAAFAASSGLRTGWIELWVVNALIDP